jgi:hypothetical protein
MIEGTGPHARISHRSNQNTAGKPARYATVPKSLNPFPYTFNPAVGNSSFSAAFIISSQVTTACR